MSVRLRSPLCCACNRSLHSQPSHLQPQPQQLLLPILLAVQQREGSPPRLRPRLLLVPVLLTLAGA
jgi:hypothetical protein